MLQAVGEQALVLLQLRAHLVQVVLGAHGHAHVHGGNVGDELVGFFQGALAVGDVVVDLVVEIPRLARQVAHFVGHYRETAPGLAGAAGFYGGIQGQQAGLVGQAFHRAQQLEGFFHVGVHVQHLVRGGDAVLAHGHQDVHIVAQGAAGLVGEALQGHDVLVLGCFVEGLDEFADEAVLALGIAVEVAEAVIELGGGIADDALELVHGVENGRQFLAGVLQHGVQPGPGPVLELFIGWGRG